MKTFILKFSAAFLLLALMGTGCEKEEEPDFQNVKGIILFRGDPATDGCGWLIEINNVEYKPQNLESIFQKEGLVVVLDFDTLNSIWNCGWREPGYQEINIVKMKIKD